MRRQPDARWLRDMSREVADHPLPDLDWERVERGVFQQLDSPGRAISLRRPAPVWPRLVAVAAVAALAAGLLLTVTTAPTNPLRATPAFPVVQAKDLAPNPDGFHAPRRGVEFVTHESSLTFNHEGWALFRLNPHGRLQITSLGDRVELNLVEGKVDATVTKHSLEDLFTVRVGNMRAAVHGTVFSVERRDHIMHVEVQQGSVAVGPVARHGTTEGWLVTAPSTGLFDLEGTTRLTSRSTVSDPIVIEPLRPVVEVEPDTSEQSPEPPEIKVSAASRPQGKPKIEEAPLDPSLPEQLTASLAASTLHSLARQIETCHHNAVPKRNDGVTIRASTTVTIRVAPDGHVVFARFDPPLSPAAQPCASSAVQSASFPRARIESVLTLPVSM